jgi:hypothetical protein
MYFYQAHYPDGTFGELKSTKEEAINDLVAAGCDVNLLVEKNGLWYTQNHDPFFGIAVARV